MHIDAIDSKTDVPNRIQMFFLLIRCVSLALSIGGLVIYLMGKLSISDLGIMLCIAVALLGIDSFRR